MGPAVALAIVGTILIIVGGVALWRGTTDVRIIGGSLVVAGASVLGICVLAVLPMR